MLKHVAENKHDGKSGGSNDDDEGVTSVTEPIVDVEQLKLIQLCFGEHEFGVILDNDAFDVAEEKFCSNTHQKLQDDINSEEQSPKAKKPVDIAFDFDPVYFVREKLNYGVPLISLCRDLDTYATYLNNTILRHVNKDVHGAFVKVSGHLVGMQDELRSVRQPVNDAVKKVEVELEKLLQLEKSVESKLNEAVEVELERLFDVGFLKLLLLYNLFCERMEELPFCLHPAKSGQQQQKQKQKQGQMENYDSSFVFFQDAVTVAACSAHVYELLCSIAVTLQQMKYLYNTLPQFSQRVKEHEEASHLLSDCGQMLYNVLSTVYIALYNEHINKSHEELKKNLVEIMGLYRTTGGVREFCQMYRERILRPLLESVLSWRAATQARHSLQETINLLSALRKQLESNIFCFLPLMREAFGNTVFPVSMIVWPAVCEALVKKMVSLYEISVAAAFQKRYLAAQELFALMEKMCASKEELCALLRSPDVALWKHKWNTDVYGTMQTNELSKRVTDAIQCVTATSIKQLAAAEKMQPQEQQEEEKEVIRSKGFKISVFALLKDALDWLFSPDTFIYPVTQTFMRAAAGETRRVIQSVLKYIEAEKSECPLQDWLSVVLGVIVDIDLFAEYIEGQFRTRLEEASGQKFALTSPFVTLLAEDTCRASVAYLKSLVQTRVVQEALAGLQNIRLVRSAYSHMQKPFPTAPSWYIPHIVEPLQRVAATVGCLVLPTKAQSEMMIGLVEEVARHFRSIAKETLVTAKKTEESLEKLRRRKEMSAAVGRGQLFDKSQTAGISPSSPNSATAATDRDKMTVQLYLDAKAFVEEGGKLLKGAVNVEELPAVVALFKSLRRAKWILGENIPEPPDIDDSDA